ncbi:ATPase AAA [Peptostreptococcus sp. MV1]|uniref:ATP-binding protein n=1 Tax=Peptostreptococcus sp. MV1 TaxID=1219626 RepID=UPI00050E8F1E|nr:ATP-binding protein [Peptostreptococcus sp. MV1]KGF14697.1 ATPase AAA [Peptostreptococcus sp. MV1]
MERDIYLEQLIRKMNNGMIKVITGIRRSGKTYLLFKLFYKYLKSEGIEESNIIKIALDDRRNIELRNPDKLYEYLVSNISSEGKYFVLLDEVQMVDEFEDVLNSMLHIDNVDVYVTGSNAKFLSKDIITEFRGRGDQIHIFPLSFSEFYQNFEGDKYDAWLEYSMYGGLPKLVSIKNNADKASYLKNIVTETYLKDILERNDVRNPKELEELLSIIASGIGGLVNPKKILDTFKRVKGVSIHHSTVSDYLTYFEDSFLISRADRYNVKGRKYISTPCKYYFSDLGLRNASLNFRQYEETHIIENIVYNELLIRGYNVDVGVVDYFVNDENSKSIRKSAEVDFVCNAAPNRIYIQVAYDLPTEEKMKQERTSLEKINDDFKKIIIVKNSPTYYTDDGILILNLFEFLLDKDSLL